jgi:uncharacterized protein
MPSVKIPVPEAVFEQHVIILGKTGSGKSSTMRLFIEHLLDKKEPVCIIDPKGDHYGLKASADGKKAGYSLVIFGGEHADVPINARSGAAIAELVATGNRSAIIDLGSWMVAERTQFWIDFASSYFKNVRGRHFLVIDEVHNFCPKGKIMDPNAGKMLHWSNRLASEGRGKGLTLVAASQRPQKVHNDFLTSCETLIAMRVIHKADRDAVKDWLDACGDEKVGKEVLSTLASFKRGEAWVYSPEVEFGPKHLKFPMFDTYDSFRPQHQRTVKLKGWAEVDLKEITKKFETTIKEAEANDPSKLKIRIAELQRELTKKLPPQQIVKDTKTETAFKQAHAAWKKQAHEMEQSISKFIAALKTISDTAIKATKIHVPNPEEFAVKPIRSKQDLWAKENALNVAVSKMPKKWTLPLNPPLQQNGDKKLQAGARRLLAVLCSVYPEGMANGRLLALAGLKQSGSSDTYKSSLKTAGFILSKMGSWYATEEGVAHLETLGEKIAPPPTTTTEVLDLWRDKLQLGARKILDALVEAEGNGVDMETITGKTGLVKSGSFDTYISSLKTAELVYKQDGLFYANKENLFL